MNIIEHPLKSIILSQNIHWFPMFSHDFLSFFPLNQASETAPSTIHPSVHLAQVLGAQKGALQAFTRGKLEPDPYETLQFLQRFVFWELSLMILMCVLLRRNKSRLFSVLGLQNGLYIDTTHICLQVKTKLAKLNLHMLGHMLVETMVETIGYFTVWGVFKFDRCQCAANTSPKSLNSGIVALRAGMLHGKMYGLGNIQTSEIGKVSNILNLADLMNPLWHENICSSDNYKCKLSRWNNHLILWNFQMLTTHDHPSSAWCHKRWMAKSSPGSTTWGLAAETNMPNLHAPKICKYQHVPTLPY